MFDIYFWFVQAFLQKKKIAESFWKSFDAFQI